MPLNWTKLAAQDERLLEDDFQRAAMRLMNEQILYESNAPQRTAYRLIVRFLDAFEEAFSLFGCRLDHNEHARYIAAVPVVEDAQRIGIKQTLMILVLAQLYDYHMSRGTLDKGIAGIDMGELATAYKASTGRDLVLKPQTEVMALLEDMKRWGVARATRTEAFGEATWGVEILPGIQSLVTERSLAKLKAHAQVNTEVGVDEAAGAAETEEETAE